MPTCKRCGATNDAESLVRHERGDLLRVRCPDCERPMGQYRHPSKR
jgi:ribosomal protein S27E